MQNIDDDNPNGESSRVRTEADVARLVICQTNEMIAMAQSLGCEPLLPTLEKVKAEAEAILAAYLARLAH